MVTHFEFYPFWILPILNSTQLWSPPSGGRTSFGKDFNAGRTSFGKDFNVLSQVFFITWGAVTAHKPTFRLSLISFWAILAFYERFWRHFMENFVQKKKRKKWNSLTYVCQPVEFWPKWYFLQIESLVTNDYHPVDIHQVMFSHRLVNIILDKNHWQLDFKMIKLQMAEHQSWWVSIGWNSKWVNMPWEFVTERTSGGGRI